MRFKLLNTHLNEMAKVGVFDNMDVVVWTNDPGKIPHFHIIDSGTGGDEFNCCIKLLTAEYFIHPGREDTLNSSDKKDLVRFLQSQSGSKRFSTFTNWQVLLTLWNMNNSDIEVDEDLEMPNYMEL